jgi:hypothetical protein
MPPFTWLASPTRPASTGSWRPTSSAPTNVYEAARKYGCARVVFASSLHDTGFYDASERISPQMPVRPDSFYGVGRSGRFYGAPAAGSRSSRSISSAACRSCAAWKCA